MLPCPSPFRNSMKEEPAKPTLQILIVDDEKNIRTTLSVTIKGLGHAVTIAASTKEALEKLQAQSFDLILTDFRLGGPTGLDLVKKAKKTHPETVMVIMTAFSSIEN